MGGWFSKDSQLTAAEQHRFARKCKSITQAYSRCHKANPADPRACTNLETSLIMCYATDLCKEASEAHQRCYMSVINTGYYKGRRTCDAEVDAMKKCLQKFKLYPFEATLDKMHK